MRQLADRLYFALVGAIEAGQIWTTEDVLSMVRRASRPLGLPAFENRLFHRRRGSARIAGTLMKRALALAVILLTTCACSKERYFRIEPVRVAPIARDSPWSGTRIQVANASSIDDEDSRALVYETRQALVSALGTPGPGDPRELAVIVEHDVRLESRMVYVATTTLKATLFRNGVATGHHWQAREKSVRKYLVFPGVNIGQDASQAALKAAVQDLVKQLDATRP